MMAETIFTFLLPQAWQDSTSMLKTFFSSLAQLLDFSFGGISVFGLMGVFLGPVLAAVVISLLEIWPLVGRRFGLLPAVERKHREKDFAT